MSEARWAALRAAAETVHPDARKVGRFSAEEVLALLAERDAAVATWRCFHCGFATADKAEAEAHFGDSDEAEPLCLDWTRLTEDERVQAVQNLCRELAGERDENATLLAERDRLAALIAQAREALENIRDNEGTKIMAYDGRSNFSCRDVAQAALAAMKEDSDATT